MRWCILCGAPPKLNDNHLFSGKFSYDLIIPITFCRWLVERWYPLPPPLDAAWHRWEALKSWTPIAGLEPVSWCEMLVDQWAWGSWTLHPTNWLIWENIKTNELRSIDSQIFQDVCKQYNISLWFWFLVNPFVLFLLLLHWCPCSWCLVLYVFQRPVPAGFRLVHWSMRHV